MNELYFTYNQDFNSMLNNVLIKFLCIAIILQDKFS